MTEQVFFKNLKKWFWAFLLGQFLVGTCIALVSWGSTKQVIKTLVETVKVHGDKIEQLDLLKADKLEFVRLETELRTKADLKTVEDLKENQNTVLEMLLQDLSDVKISQNRILNLLVSHIQNPSSAVGVDTIQRQRMSQILNDINKQRSRK